MPPFSSLKVRAIDELAKQLRFAPADALARHVERIESLVGEVDPSAAYPADWVVFKVTSFRPGPHGPPFNGPAPTLIKGEDLLADLPALVERLSAGARMDWSSLAAEGAVDVHELCDRWNVSKKTLDRYRRRGLIARRAVGPTGKPKLVFMPKVVHEFAERHGAELARASDFSRIPAELESRILRRAARYRRIFGCSLNQAAKRLAMRFERSHEAIRQLLARHALEPDGTPIFDDPGPIDEKQRRTAFRAWRRGISPVEVSKRWKKSPATVLRAVLLERAIRVRVLVNAGALTAPHAVMFDRPDADSVVLAPEPVRAGLGAPGATDLLDWLEVARVRTVPLGVEETARATAYQFLRYHTRVLVGALDKYNPRAGAIDQIETHLRWASLIKAELIRSHLSLVVLTLEGILGAPLDQLPVVGNSARLRLLIVESIAAAIEAVDQFDPYKAGRFGGAGGRLAAPIGLAVTKVGTRWLKEARGGAPSARRATGRLLRGVPIDDWTRAVAPWQEFLEPDRRVRAVLMNLEPRCAAFLSRRFGWYGGPPRTLAELGAAMGLDTPRSVRFEREALRDALKVARA